MEINLAILIADLSGYTALTETHGSSSAADLIDRYVEIAQDCLVADCKLHERVGDEIMIVSPSADFLLATAHMLIQQTSAEHNFLQLHGGLHYGKLLKRNSSYFGTTLNLASRIASKARPGTFLCSKEYMDALSENPVINFQSKGKESFKNITRENELFELVIENQNIFHIDPVCRMLIIHKEKAIQHPSEAHIYFCSSDCLEIFNRTQQSD